MDTAVQDLSRSFDGDAHRDALSAGLRQWHDFVRACLDGAGPSGVESAGGSTRDVARRAEAAQLENPGGGNLFGLVVSAAQPRLVMASSHLAATATVLSDVEALGSLPALLRAWSEASARAAWLLDGAISVTDAIERALTDWLGQAEQVRKLGVPSSGAAHASMKALVDEIAASVGVSPKRRPPAAVDLIQQYGEAENVGRNRDQVARTYRFDSGAVHSSLTGWISSVLGRGASGGMEIEGLHRLVAGGATALHLHARAVDEWAALSEWRPRRRFDDARRLAFDRAWHPFVDLHDAVRHLVLDS